MGLNQLLPLDLPHLFLQLLLALGHFHFQTENLLQPRGRAGIRRRLLQQSTPGPTRMGCTSFQNRAINGARTQLIIPVLLGSQLPALTRCPNNSRYQTWERHPSLGWHISKINHLQENEPGPITNSILMHERKHHITRGDRGLILSSRGSRL